MPQRYVGFWSFHILIMGACFDLWEKWNWREQFEIRLDEQLVFGAHAA